MRSNPVLMGSNEGETIVGDIHTQAIYGLAGDDHLFQAAYIYGGAGNDLALGGLISSGVVAGSQMHMGEGDDLALAAGGDNWFYGEGGNDTLNGSSGYDVLFGGDGNDLLRSGGGTDYMTGGEGADIFSVGFVAGASVLMDFEPGVDKIAVPFGMGRPLDHVTQYDGFVVVTVREAQNIWLMGMSASQLSDSDFIFNVF